MAGRSLAGSIAWPTSAPACHSSRAACPKSGWPQLPYSPVWARSSTEANWRRQRMPPPQPPWPPCHPAHLLRPPAHPPPCLVTLATSPAGRGCMACWETLGWTCYIGSQVTENLLQLMDLSTAKGPVRLILAHGGVSAKHLKKSWAVKCFFPAEERSSYCWQRRETCGHRSHQSEILTFSHRICFHYFTCQIPSCVYQPHPNYTSALFISGVDPHQKGMI